MSIKLYITYVIELDYSKAINIQEKFGFISYNETIGALINWCKKVLGDPPSTRWEYKPVHDIMTDLDIFIFRNESDRTLFMITWL